MTTRRSNATGLVFSDNMESRVVLCRLITFLPPSDLAAVECTAPLFCRGDPSVVAKMVLDALKVGRLVVGRWAVRQLVLQSAQFAQKEQRYGAVAVR